MSATTAAPTTESQEAAGDGMRSDFNLIPALLCWLVPGLGHIVIGEKRRGLTLMIAILGLYFAGILIGGVSVIDRYDRAEPPNSMDEPGKSLWYYGQIMVAPTLAIDRLRHSMVRSHEEAMRDTVAQTRWSPKPGITPPRGGDIRTLLVPAEPGNVPPAYEPSIGRVAEQGLLYTSLAGMLNLLTIIELIGRHRRPDDATPPAPAAAPAAGGAA